MHAAKIRENVRLLRCADPGHFVLQQQQILPYKWSQCGAQCFETGTAKELPADIINYKA